MTIRPTSNGTSDSTPSRSEIESALLGKTKRNTQRSKRPAIDTFDLSAPPRRQQVIGGKLSGISKRNKFGLFSRYSDISVANWIALIVVALIMMAFFWPSSKESTKETKVVQFINESQLGETDLTQSEQAEILEVENSYSELGFSRNSDVDRANNFREQEEQDSQISNLLNQARTHIENDRYSSPENSNAADSYKEILIINQNNIAAKQGLNFIKGQLLESGLMLLEQDDVKEAENKLSDLSSVNKNSEEYQDLVLAIANWKVQRQVNLFNKQGIAALNRGNLILPSKKNALYFFKQALNLNENDEIAAKGTRKVAEQFVNQANEAVTLGQYNEASAYLASISIIDPEHKSIKPLEAALNRALLIQKAQREQVTAQTTANEGVSNPLIEDSRRTPNSQTLEQQTFDKEYLKQGLESYYQGDYDIAAALLQPLADKGIARAQFRLAYMHYLGRGYEKNTSTADAMIRAALPAIQKFADNNRAWAQSDLGSLYEDGLVLARNFNKAVAWYRSAAEQGYPGAQTNLGMMYARGRGVNANRKTAIRWFKKAADQGDSVAKRNLIAMGVKN